MIQIHPTKTRWVNLGGTQLINKNAAISGSFAVLVFSLGHSLAERGLRPQAHFKHMDSQKDVN
jgi:hypothetical protein